MAGHTASGSDNFVGLIAIIVLIALLAGVTVLIRNAWPASAYLVGAIALFLAVRRSSNPWAKAAKSLTLSATIGFGALTASLWVFNLLLWNRDLASPVSRFELFLLRLSILLPSWTKLNWWRLVLVLCMLLIVNRAVPTLKVVTRFLWVKKIAARATAALAIVTSFSFFTDDALLGNIAGDLHGRLTVQYTASRQKERQQLARYLATRIEEEAIRDLPKDHRRYIANVIKRVSATEKLSIEAKVELVRSEGARFTERPAEPAVPDFSSDQPPAGELERTPESTIARQTRQEEAAKDLADTEERTALQEIVGSVIGAGTGELKQLATEYLHAAFGVPASLLLVTVDRYLDQRIDTSLNAVTDPLVKKSAASLQAKIHRRQQLSGDSADEAAIVVREAIRGYIARARGLADDADAALARAETNSALTAPDSLDVLSVVTANRNASYARAESASQEAARLVRMFGSVAADVGLDSTVRTTDALLVKTQSRIDTHNEAVARERERVERIERDRVERENRVREYEHPVEAVP